MTISANRLRITIRTTDRSSKSQRVKLKQISSRLTFSSHFIHTVQTSMSLWNAPWQQTEFIFSTYWIKMGTFGRAWFAFTAGSLRWLKTNTRGHQKAFTARPELIFFLLNLGVREVGIVKGKHTIGIWLLWWLCRSLCAAKMSEKSVTNPKA